MFDEIQPDAPRREAGESGFITPQLAANAAGGVAGTAAGSASGEDTQDRIWRGLLFGVAGAAAPALFRNRSTRRDR